jgi:enoyl-CoA hydratase/carnithine racemase
MAVAYDFCLRTRSGLAFGPLYYRRGDPPVGALDRRDRRSKIALQEDSVAESHDDRPLVLRSFDAGVVTLTLNRGERFNPLSSAMIDALAEELDAAATDPAARVVVLAAAGKGFSAGHDLKEMRAHASDKQWQRALFDRCGRMMMRLTSLPQPVIARVHGIATAAGCQLVSMCDLAVASETATFALPGVNIGVFCSTPAVGVARNVGRKHAMELLLTGAPVDAHTAKAWGLVNRVVPADALDSTIAQFTDAIKARSAATIRLGKEAFYAQIEQPIARAYDATSEVMACNMLLDDASEGIDAFLGKRLPVWQGQ